MKLFSQLSDMKLFSLLKSGTSLYICILAFLALNYFSSCQHLLPLFSCWPLYAQFSFIFIYSWSPWPYCPPPVHARDPAVVQMEGKKSQAECCASTASLTPADGFGAPPVQAISLHCHQPMLREWKTDRAHLLDSPCHNCVQKLQAFH